MLRIISYILFILFLFTNQGYTVESFEDDARQKRLGLEQKEKNSIEVTHQHFFRDIELNNIEVIKRSNLISNINFRNIKGTTPLIHAVLNNKIEIVDFFFNNTDVNINFEDELGNTALITASKKGNLELLKYLIDKGADLNSQNKNGYTSLMEAVENNHFYIVKELVLKGADRDKTDYVGRTVRDISEERTRDKRILKLIN